MLSLRERRELLGMTQAEMGQRLGVNANHISLIEQGKVKLPDIELRRELARALGIRHIDVLVAQGILDDWEMPGFSPDTPLRRCTGPRPMRQ